MKNPLSIFNSKFFINLFQIVSFFVILLLIDHVSFYFIKDRLHKYRPSPSVTQDIPLVEIQILRHELTLGEKSDIPKIVFFGSSSVVNGLDVNLIKQKWEENKINLNPINAGMTTAMAYEIPFMKKYFSNNIKGIVYLYNTFSFPDKLHPSLGILKRWDTLEFLKEANPKEVIINFPRLLIGLTYQTFYLFKYKDFIIYHLKDTFNHTLKLPVNDYDYSTSEPPMEVPKALSGNPNDDTWNRHIFTSSQTQEENFGYRGLKRLLVWAKSKNIPLIVMPVPEPSWASLYARDKFQISNDLVDNHVRKICEEVGIPFIPRSETAWIENNGNLFRDFLHLHWSGRKTYSEFLSTFLPQKFPEIFH